MSAEWVQAADSDLADLRSYATAHEWRCIAFSSALAFRRYSGLFLRRSGAEIGHALMLGARGQVLPVFRDPVRLPRHIVRLFPRAHSVMGTDISVRSVEHEIGRPPRKAVDYHLMVLDRSAASSPSSSDFAPTPADCTVRRASQADRQQLYPLARDYEKEEVLLDPALHVPRICRAHLRRTLREQVVYVTEAEGRIVSKAGTNTRGVRGDQIGGVFTLADRRHRGYAAAAMTALLNHVFAHREFACLFVKRDNPAAIALYKGLGFEVRDRYRIAYYYPSH